jgi:hypothetical protein
MAGYVILVLLLAVLAAIVLWAWETRDRGPAPQPPDRCLGWRWKSVLDIYTGIGTRGVK